MALPHIFTQCAYLLLIRNHSSTSLVWFCASTHTLIVKKKNSVFFCFFFQSIFFPTRFHRLFQSVTVFSLFFHTCFSCSASCFVVIVYCLCYSICVFSITPKREYIFIYGKKTNFKAMVWVFCSHWHRFHMQFNAWHITYKQRNLTHIDK